MGLKKREIYTFLKFQKKIEQNLVFITLGSLESSKNASNLYKSYEGVKALDANTNSGSVKVGKSTLSG